MNEVDRVTTYAYRIPFGVKLFHIDWQGTTGQVAITHALLDVLPPELVRVGKREVGGEILHGNYRLHIIDIRDSDYLYLVAKKEPWTWHAWQWLIAPGWKFWLGDFVHTIRQLIGLT